MLRTITPILAGAALGFVLFKLTQPRAVELTRLSPTSESREQTAARPEDPRSRQASSRIAGAEPGTGTQALEQQESSDRQIPSSAEQVSAIAVFEPVPVDPAIESLLKGPLIEAHERLQREHRDGSWAPFVESQLSEFLISDNHVLNAYENPQIVCRATMCELQMVIKDDQADADGEDQPGVNWFRIREDIHSQPWGQEFISSGGYVDEQGVFWIFHTARNAQ